MNINTGGRINERGKIMIVKKQVQAGKWEYIGEGNTRALRTGRKKEMIIQLKLVGQGRLVHNIKSSFQVF